MLLGDILREETISTSLEATDRFAAIQELISLLVSSHVLPESLRDHVTEVVNAREHSMSTGMEDGVALPHGTSDRVDKVIGALGISRQGIDFGCLDCSPARLVVLLVLPRNKFQVHVRTLAGVSHLLNDKSFRKFLLDSASPSEALERIRDEEGGPKGESFRFRFNPFS